MKTRTNKIIRSFAGGGRFALHPLSFAICLGLSGAALALPQGGTVVAGDATISRPSGTTEVIRQATDKAIIDWRSFSIGAGERVRFYQPSSTSVTLNRVTGYDPSSILGQLSSNGKIFLLNPYGVVFGEGARVDVGGLVVSTLSMANNDFLASRYSLTSVDPAAPTQRGAIVNEGIISAPGGTVVLAGPSVTNSGTIVANGGRVGLVAANAVSVDVEGDGLLFFQASATEANNRLAQLGRIQADGGSVEMRAAARAAFADTVLNMSGVVQAKTIGTRDGRIVIDGGADGITAVSGRLDASGTSAGEHGGRIAVQGGKVLIDDTARIDASGDAGGGAIRVGGDFHGANAGLRNAEQTLVLPGAEMRADALTRGDGGSVVVWADGSTRYYGQASVKGGALGGNGGQAEVSGKSYLDYQGLVDATAANGKVGNLLLDPTDITISGAASSAGIAVTGGANRTFTDVTTPSGTSILNVGALQTQLAAANVTVDATPAAVAGAPGGGTITVAAPILWSSNKDLTLKAATDITVNAGSTITNDTLNGALNLFASGNVTLNAAVSLQGGAFTVAGTTGGASRAASFTSGAGGTVTTSGPAGTTGVRGGDVTIATTGDLTVAAIATRGGAGATPGDSGNVSLTASNGAITTASIDTRGGDGTVRNGAAVGGHGGNVTVSIAAGSHALVVGAITASGGKGSNNQSVPGKGGTGGGGGTVSISNLSSGNTTTQSIDSSGGNAGASGGGNNADGGDGGDAGVVTVTANGGTLATGSLKSAGGAFTLAGGGAGADGSAGLTRTVALDFGQTSAGTLDLTNTTALGATPITATGGAGTDTVVIVGGAAENIVLANALLTRPTAGNVALASVENAALTTGTGTTNLAGWTGGRTATVQLTAGAGAITGNGAGTTLIGQAAGSTFNIATPNAGTADGTAFSNVFNLTGGAGADTFTVADLGFLGGAINGGLGVNTLNLAARTVADFGLTSSSTGTASGVGAGYSNVTNLVGNPATSTLSGRNVASSYTVTADNAGSVDDGTGTTTFSGIARLAGGTAADAFSINGAFALAGIDGGSGAANTLSVSGAAGDLTLADALLTRTTGGPVTLANIASATLAGDAGNNVISGAAWTGALTLQLTAGTDTLTGNALNTILQAPAAGATINVTGAAGIGNSGGTTFSGIQSLRGGAGIDRFVVGNAGTLAGSITGVGGNDTLDLGTRGTADFGLASASSGTVSGVAGGYTGISTLVGNPATSTLTGTGTASTYAVSAAGTGTVDDGVGTTSFSGMRSLVGGGNADLFVFAAAGTLGGSVDGGGGSNTLDLSAIAGSNFTLATASSGTASALGGGYSSVATLKGSGNASTLTGSNTGSTFSVSAANAGTVNDGVGTTTFSGIGSLAGGTGADTFTIANAGSLGGSVDGGGGAGVNTLNLGARTTADFGLTTATSGTASGVIGGFSNVSALVGNNTSSTLTGSNTGSTFTVNAANGGTVNDGVGTTAFSGIDSLKGGTGADSFAILNGGTLTGSIDGGAGSNTLNLSARTTANFTLSGAAAGSVSGVAGTYANVATLTGNATTSTLTGSGTGSTFSVASGNTGTVNDGVGTTTFTGMASLAGGSGADTFTIGNAGTLTGSINGGGGVNTLNLAALGTADFTLSGPTAGSASGIAGGYSNVSTLVGNGGTSTLTGRNAGSVFTVTANNAGNVDGTTSFSGVPHLVGGSGADSFVIGAGFAMATVDGGTGSNSLTATASAGNENLTLTNTLLTRSLTTNVGVSNIGSATLVGSAGNNTLDGSAWTGALGLQLSGGTDILTGNGANTTLIAPPTGATITVTGALGTGTSGTTTFSQVGNLLGGAGSDVFAMAAGGTLAGNVTGVGGNDTLDLSAKAGPITINQGGNITGSGVAGTIAGVSTIVGSGATTTFVGSNVGQTYTIGAPDSVTVAGVTVNGVGSITAGSSADTFVVQAAGTLSGSINGGGGGDTLDVSAKPGAAFALTSATSGSATGVSGGYSNVSALVGSGAASTLTGSNVGSTFTVSGPNSGSVNDGVGTTTFSGVGSLVGGNAADSFAVGNAGSLSGTVNGGAGANTLDLSARGTGNFALATASSGTATGIGGGYSNVSNLIGNNGSSTLTGTNSGTTYSVSGANAGTVNGGAGTTTFSGIGNLVGGAGADTVVVANAGSLSGSIDAGAGSNSLDLSARGIANFGLTSPSSGSASGIGGGYANIATLIGNDTTSTLTGTATGSVFIVTGPNAGFVDDGFGTTNFSKIASLAGGVGGDYFLLAGGSSLVGSVNGGAGANTLDLSNLATANFGLTGASAGSASGVGGGFANIATLFGNGATSTLTGSNTGSTFTITSTQAGTVNDGVGTTTFAGVPNLAGGTGADTFVVGAGLVIGSIDGGSGAVNTLAATALASENLTLANTLLARSASSSIGLANIGNATLTGGSGNNIINASGWSGGRTVTVVATGGFDTVTGNGVGTTLLGTASPSLFTLSGPDSGTLTDGFNLTTFSGVGNLTGGAGNDTFAIQNPGTLSGNLDGGGGSNTLDLSLKSSASIVFNTTSSSVTGVGIAGTFTNIGSLIGNSTNTTLLGNAAGQAFAITADNEITVGGSQVFKGVGNLDAGIGNDSISGTTFKLSGHIADAGGTATLSGTIRTDGSQTYAGPVIAPTINLVALGGLSATNAANDFGNVSLTGGAIDVRDSNAINLSAVSVGAGQSLAVQAGTITLNGNVTTTANQTYAGNVLLAADAALSAGPGNLSLQGNVDGGTHNLTLTSGAVGANAVSIGGSVANVAAFASNGSTTLAGNVTSTGAQTYNGALTLAGNAVLDAGAAKIDLRSSVAGGGNSLVAASSNLAADAIKVGGAIGNVSTFSATGPTTLGANVVTTGAQTYSGAVTLVSDATLNAGAGTLALQGGVNGGARNLTLVSSGAAPGAIALGGPVANVGVFTATGNASLGGDVTSSGAQTYGGTVVLTANAALNAGAAKIDLVGAVDAGGHNLALTSANAAADAIRARAAIANAAQLTVTGKSTLASGIVTTGAQTYTDAVSLGGNASFSGSSLSFGNGIAGGAADIALRGDTLTLNGTVTGTGNATISSAGAGTTVGVAGGAGTLQLGQTTLDKFGSFASLTVGRADGTGDLTFGNLVLPTHLAVLSGSGKANFTGTVASAAGLSRDLTVTTGGNTTFSGAVGGAIGGSAALGTVAVAGPTTLSAGVTSTGTQSYGGAVTVGGDATLSASALSFGSSLDIATHSLTLFSDGLALGGAAIGSGGGNVRIAPRAATGTMGVAGGAGALQVSQGLVDAFAGVPTLTLGRTDSTAAVTVGNVVLPADMAITNGSGNVVFTGTVDSAAGPARDLTVTTTGATTLAGAIGATRAIDALTITGAAQLGANITTSGAQTYTGAATLAADTTLSGPSVAFGNSVDGGHALVVNAASTSFAGAVGGTAALTSLLTDAAGTTQLGGNVRTTGTQTYRDALQLNGNAVLSGSTLTLAGSVDGNRSLALDGSTGVSLGGVVGGNTALTSLSVAGPLQLGAPAITTSGGQTFAGPTTLGAASTLTASSIVFGNTLDGGFGLTLQSPSTSFAGAVGATAALASLSANGGGTVSLAGPSIATTGPQSYSGALQLSGAGRLTGSSLTLGGPVTGATDLTLQTNALNGASALGGSGTLTITPIDATLSIGIAGGPGALQVPQAVLDGAAGFKAHVIGRSDGSGTISAGNLTLRSDTTLQTATGDLTLAGTLDGPFAMTLDSGGTTRIAGPVGAGAALKSLITDNNPSAADWNGTTGERTNFDTADGTGAARVITTGAQTYNDPVTATVPIFLTGGAVTATQTANRFDGKVSATADTLDLRNSTDLQLGAIRLLNGGSLETDGVLHIAGALQLDGGTLVLTSNAIPTPTAISDPEYANKTFSLPLKEATATVIQDIGGTLTSAAGSLLAVRSPSGGSILLDQPGNALLGQISAVSGTLGDNDPARFANVAALNLGLIRIVSSEIHVAGRPPADGNQTLLQAGLEGDFIKLTADVLATGPDGLIRARLPFNNILGAQNSLPGLTLVLSPTALTKGGGFGAAAADAFIQVQVGAAEGGFITARPNGVSGNNAVIFLGGSTTVRPFYDGNGKLTEIRVFYNGDAPRTPQEAGALAAVIALIEEARHARFEEAVRTENVSSRLRSGVIAEVGAGRPATVGRESIRLPDTCDIKPKALECQ